MRLPPVCIRRTNLIQRRSIFYKIGSWNADDEGRLRSWTIVLQKGSTGGNVGNNLVNESVVDGVFEKCSIDRTCGSKVRICNDR